MLGWKMHCLSHGLKAESALGNFNSQGSWPQVTETQLLPQAKGGIYWLAKLESPRLDVTIFRFSKICHHKSVFMSNLFPPPFYPSITYVLSMSICHLLSVLCIFIHHHHHYCFSLLFPYSHAESQIVMTMPRIMFTS